MRLQNKTKTKMFNFDYITKEDMKKHKLDRKS